MGIILALGAGHRRVLRMVIIEALVLAGIGTAIGSVIGIALVQWGSDGIGLPQSYHDIYQQIGISAEIAMSMSMTEALISALMMLVIAVLAAWLPAYHTSRQEPVKVMKGI